MSAATPGRPGSAGRRRRFPLPRRTLTFRAVAVLVITALAAWRFIVDEPAPPAPHAPGSAAVVLRAVDGDTLLLADDTRVRLLGVDTPETKRPEAPVEPWGAEAHEFTRSYVEGRTVRLEFDKERHDKYDRVLAYVYLGDWFLNEELIRAGMGRAITNHPYSEAMKRRFRAAEREAQQQRRGIWSGGVPVRGRRGGGNGVPR